MTISYKLRKIIRKSETRKLLMRTHNSALPRMCRNPDGNLIVRHPQVLERWKEYFTEMFTVAESEQISDIMGDLGGNHDFYTEPPTYNEVCTIINRLRNNKAAGPDNITPELNWEDTEIKDIYRIPSSGVWRRVDVVD
jgi:hypothetical protein